MIRYATKAPKLIYFGALILLKFIRCDLVNVIIQPV